MNKYDLIINNVAKLHKTYDSYDPLTICNQLGIKVHFFDLKQKLKGFFFYQSRQKNIVIDSNVNEIFKRILVAHELGHALLHNKSALSYGFYDSEVFEQRSFVENEANFFARVISGKQPDCKLAMDFESFGNLSTSEINEISKVFLETLQNATNKEVLIYSNSYSARTIFSSELAIYPLWVANYGVSEPRRK